MAHVEVFLSNFDPLASDIATFQQTPFIDTTNHTIFAISVSFPLMVDRMVEMWRLMTYECGVTMFSNLPLYGDF